VTEHTPYIDFDNGLRFHYVDAAPVAAIASALGLQI